MKNFFFASISLILCISLILIACGMENPNKSSGSVSAAPAISAYAPLSVVIAISGANLLEKADTVAALAVDANTTLKAYTLSTDGYTANGVGSNMVSGGVSGTSSTVNVDTAATISATAALTTFDASAGLSATVSVTPTFSRSVNAACATIAPYNLLACSMAGGIGTVTVTAVSLTNTDFSVKAYALEEPTSYLVSNALPVTIYSVAELSNTYNAHDDSPTNLMVFDDKLFFKAYKAAGKTKLYYYDDLETNSDEKLVQVSDTCSGGDDAPAYLTNYNKNLFFIANDATPNAKIMKYNGTSITKVSNTSNGNDDAPSDLTVCGTNWGQNKPGMLFFRALNFNGNTKLYSYNDRTSTINTITNTMNDVALNDSPGNITLGSNLEIFFGSNNTGPVRKLYSYSCADTDVPTLTRISNMNAGHDLPVVTGTDILSSFGATYFTGKNSIGTKLFKYDYSKIKQLSSIHSDGDDDPNHFLFYNSTLMFTATNDGANYSVYKYDGTDIEKLPVTYGASWDPEFTVMNGNLYFVAKNATPNIKLFKFDGTTTTQISDTNAGDDSPSELTVYNNKLFFNAIDSGGFTKLFAYDGTNLVQVMNINTGDNDNPTELTVYNNKLFFSALKDPLNSYKKLYSLCDSTAGCD